MTQLPTHNVLLQPMICQHMSVGKSGSWCSVSHASRWKQGAIHSSQRIHGAESIPGVAGAPNLLASAVWEGWRAPREI